MSGRKSAGNVLGELTAEADEVMLHSAFLETANYRALAQDTDFRFVIGRRGTGKSALFRKLSETLAADRQVLLITNRPEEHTMAAYRGEIARLTQDYTSARLISKLAWKVQILTQTADAIITHYKSDRIDAREGILKYRTAHEAFFNREGIERSLVAVRTAVGSGLAVEQLPELIATHFEVNRLQKLVSAALEEMNKRAVVLYDGLDEGWTPDLVAIGIIGGLAKLAAESAENRTLHCLLFVRDNMSRALAQHDGDYSRNIEGNTLRLHWEAESLLSLVALRLRANSGHTGENDLRAWDRFAKRELQGMSGFLHCLKLTLYRPRDVIALLNGAFKVATGAGRTEIVPTDVDTMATSISRTRLNDLYKEYDVVFPGLRDFCEVFRGRAPRLTYLEARAALSKVVETEQEGISVQKARTFALLQTDIEAFSALYSVGFIGVQDANGSVRFCHDGSNTDTESVAPDRSVVVHPCYWRGLDLQEQETTEILVKVDDEDDPTNTLSGKQAIATMRLRKLGAVIAELGKIREGLADAVRFEKWAFDAVRYLFAKGLENIAWRPNPGQVQQRDIVGTIKEAGGFWRRLAKYDVSQLIIEVKNFQEVDATAFRQAWGYLKGPYGRCMLMITRSEQEALTEHERALVKEGYDSDPHKMVILMPAMLLQRMLRKMQNAIERDDYVESRLSKRLDLFEREFIQQKTPRVKR